MSPRRLEAEAIRDAILATSGRLDPRMGGPGLQHLGEEHQLRRRCTSPAPTLGPDDFRRMVYQFKPRSQQDPTFGAFDCPDAALVAPRRNVSTTALQALNLLNSRVHHPAGGRSSPTACATEAGTQPDRQAERGFPPGLRPPADGRRATAAARLIAAHGTAAFCRALYNANEFVYVP